MHFNENSQRKQARTEQGEDRWVVIYPKVHKGEKSIARKIKEEATYKYIEAIQLESLKLRAMYQTLKRAKKHAQHILPKEPMSLVEKYLGGNQAESKASVVARRYSRFSKPAYPVENGQSICNCSGKCATMRCACKALGNKCTSVCQCKLDLCSNK